MSDNQDEINVSLPEGLINKVSSESEKLIEKEKLDKWKSFKSEAMHKILSSFHPHP